MLKSFSIELGVTLYLRIISILIILLMSWILLATIYRNQTTKHVFQRPHTNNSRIDLFNYLGLLPSFLVSQPMY
jgi:hypothetical protein